MAMAPRTKLYTVEVTYRCGEKSKLFRITNLDAPHLKQLRENMFVGGVYRRIDDDTGEVISPWSIIETMVYKQAHFFNAVEDDKDLVNGNSNYSPKK